MCSLCVSVTGVIVVMLIANGLRLEISFPCGSKWGNEDLTRKKKNVCNKNTLVLSKFNRDR